MGYRTVFRLLLSAPQGFAQSLLEPAFATLPAPNYTTLCRRAQTLVCNGEPIHLVVVDNTGAKAYCEGERKVRRHGYSKRRKWRKAHPTLDANAGQLRAALMTHQDVVDGDVLPNLLDQIPADE